MIVTVPLEVSLPKGVVIQTDSYTSPTLKYRMCTRDGCFVQTAVDNAIWWRRGEVHGRRQSQCRRR